MKISKSVLLGFLIIFVSLFIIQIKTCNESNEKDSIIQTQYNVMTSKRDAEGRETVSRQVVEAGFDAMRKYYGDSIKRIIDRNTVSLTRAKIQTTNGGTTATTIRSDTTGRFRRFKNDETKSGTPGSAMDANISITGGSRLLGQDSGRTHELPIYETVHTDKWQSYSITAGPDSTILIHTSYNEYSIKTEFVKNGKGLKAFFQPKVLQVSITNENPQTQTIGVDSWHVPVKKNTGLRLGTGIAIGVGIGYLLFH